MYYVSRIHERQMLVYLCRSLEYSSIKMLGECSKLHVFWGFYGVDYEDCSSCDMTTFLLVNDWLCFGMF
jgi:hypothetical protein